MAGSATSALSVRYSSGMSRSPASCVCRYLRYLSTRAIEAVAMHACNIGSSESRNEVVAVADIQLGRARHSFTAAWLFVADAGRPLRRIRCILIVLLSSFTLIHRSFLFRFFPLSFAFAFASSASPDVAIYFEVSLSSTCRSWAFTSSARILPCSSLFSSLLPSLRSRSQRPSRTVVPLTPAPAGPRMVAA